MTRGVAIDVLSLHPEYDLINLPSSADDLSGGTTCVGLTATIRSLRAPAPRVFPRRPGRLSTAAADADAAAGARREGSVL